MCSFFKGMVVKDREAFVTDSIQKGENVFLLGKSISKWTITKKYFTDYKKLKIVGGTKKINKHNQFPRILIRRTGDTLCCSLLNEAALTESTLYSCWSLLSNISNKYLLAVLNSKLLDYYIKNLMITNKQAFPQILMTDLENLPIKKIDLDKQLPFTILVDRILAITNPPTSPFTKGGQEGDYLQNPNKQAQVRALEREIDQMVYQLYGLTEEEIAIVEESLNR